MSRKENLSYIFLGSLIFLIGFALVIFRETFVLFLAEIIQIILLIIGGWELFNAYIINRNDGSLIERSITAGKALIYIVVGQFLASRPEFTTGWLIFFIGLYQFAMGLIGLISYILLRRDNVSGLNTQLIITLVHFIFGVFSMTGSRRITNTLVRLGIYLIFIGFTYINDGRQLLNRKNLADKLQKRIRIPLPVFIEAIIPNNVMIKFNEQLQGKEAISLSNNRSRDSIVREYEKRNIIHILIHVGATGFDKIGHVDISYQGKVYSYGNHDIEAQKLGGAIGDGVLVVADEKLYLKYLKSRRTSVFRFGIGLNDEEMKEFKTELDRLLKQIKPWTLETDRQKKSFIGRVLQSTGGRAFKFNKGRYKTYFVLGTNCVLLADELLGNNGINIINLTGILAPGTYYDYFNKLFHTYGTNVISKVLVHPQLEKPIIESKHSQDQ